MVLTDAAVNQIVDEFTGRLNAGYLAFFPEAPSALNPLAVIALGVPAFEPAQGGVAVGREIASTIIERTGEARLAQLLTPQQEVLATLIVRSLDAPDRDQADALLDRTDFHQGGICTVARLVLRMPRMAA